ncbi:MAG: amidohydrolase family protein [Thermoplasmata archaeon]
MPGRRRHGPEEGTYRPAVPELVLAGRAFRRGRVEPLEVGIDGEGRIVQVGRNVRGAHRHDVGDRLLLPSATDIHVHFRHPDRSHGVESFADGTIQAALGGVALVGEMPNSDPPVTTTDRLIDRRTAGRGRLAVDMLLYAALTEARRVPGLARECGAFKLYLAPTTGIEAPPGPERTRELLKAVAATGAPLSVHAEDPGRFGPSDRSENTMEWNDARPLASEEAAIDGVLGQAPAGLRLNFAHVTSSASVERVARAGFACEVTPHHLLLAARRGGGAREKVNPPLRTEAVRLGLMEQFSRGRIPFLASDHAPHSAEAKGLAFAKAPSGLPGVGTLLPLLLAEVRAGALDLSTVIRAACERPALWFGAPLGRLAAGYRADLLVVDPRVRRPIRAAEGSAPCGWSAFEGWEGIFPEEHYRAGSRIVAAGEYVGRPTGIFHRPGFLPAP